MLKSSCSSAWHGWHQVVSHCQSRQAGGIAACSLSRMPSNVVFLPEAGQQCPDRELTQADQTYFLLSPIAGLAWLLAGLQPHMPTRLNL